MITAGVTRFVCTSWRNMIRVPSCLPPAILRNSKV
ncbi:hypothetical protein EYB39_22985 [Pantoea agglomerans]|nr:hypothetical protein EYB39_22985 [Pantoea agglomerans]